jgi:hypothetical protein
MVFLSGYRPPSVTFVAGQPLTHSDFLSCRKPTAKKQGLNRIGDWIMILLTKGDEAWHNKYPQQRWPMTKFLIRSIMPLP